MSAPDDDRTASLMTPAKLAQLKVRPAPAASPAAWLDQMAADAGAGHVRRLADLRQQLESAVRAREGDLRPVAASCHALHEAVGGLDYGLLQPKGWLARATGKGKEAAATFDAGHRRMQRTGEDLVDEVRELQKKLAAQATGLDRTMMEIGVEVAAIEKIMDQGARWLQDMRNQLKARQAGSPDATEQQLIAQDNARCELLVARLKVLRTLVSATQQALEHTKGVAGRRVALAGSLQQLLDGEWKAAAKQVGAVAAAAAAGAKAPEGVDEAQRAGEALQSQLAQAGEDCASVQAAEQGAADELAALQGPLQAAA